LTRQLAGLLARSEASADLVEMRGLAPQTPYMRRTTGLGSAIGRGQK
jgi:hypothetical protein